MIPKVIVVQEEFQPIDFQGSIHKVKINSLQATIFKCFGHLCFLNIVDFPSPNLVKIDLVDLFNGSVRNSN